MSRLRLQVLTSLLSSMSTGLVVGVRRLLIDIVSCIEDGSETLRRARVG
jgi:hypothetical protein